MSVVTAGLRIRRSRPGGPCTLFRKLGGGVKNDASLPADKISFTHQNSQGGCPFFQELFPLAQQRCHGNFFSFAHYQENPLAASPFSLAL